MICVRAWVTASNLSCYASMKPFNAQKQQAILKKIACEFLILRAYGRFTSLVRQSHRSEGMKLGGLPPPSLLSTMNSFYLLTVHSRKWIHGARTHALQKTWSLIQFITWNESLRLNHIEKLCWISAFCLPVLTVSSCLHPNSALSPALPLTATLPSISCRA